MRTPNCPSIFFGGRPRGQPVHKKICYIYHSHRIRSVDMVYPVASYVSSLSFDISKWPIPWILDFLALCRIVWPTMGLIVFISMVLTQETILPRGFVGFDFHTVWHRYDQSYNVLINRPIDILYYKKQIIHLLWFVSMSQRVMPIHSFLSTSIS